MLDLRYTTAYLFPAISFWALATGGIYLWIIPAITFMVIPLAEVFFVGTTDNLTEEVVEDRSKNKLYD